MSVLGIQNILKKTSLSLILIFSFAEAFSNQEINTPVSVEAESTINMYYSALSDGNVDAIRSLLGRSLLRGRDRLLSNPNYGTKLRSIYQDSQVNIISSQVIDSLTVATIVEVTNSIVTKNRYRFVLKKIEQSGMRILSEDEIL